MLRGEERGGEVGVRERMLKGMRRRTRVFVERKI